LAHGEALDVAAEFGEKVEAAVVVVEVLLEDEDPDVDNDEDEREPEVLRGLARNSSPVKWEIDSGRPSRTAGRTARITLRLSRCKSGSGSATPRTHSPSAIDSSGSSGCPPAF
jgi:hypothetical protein